MAENSTNFDRIMTTKDLQPSKLYIWKAEGKTEQVKFLGNDGDLYAFQREDGRIMELFSDEIELEIHS